MVNKRGFLRIIEAVIAVLIILGVLLVVSINQQTNFERELLPILGESLDEIAKNNTIRNAVLTESPFAENMITNFLDERFDPIYLNHSVSICNATEICGLQENYPEEINGEVFVDERIISSSLDAPLFEPKKIKVFLWQI